jgi:hypothetical protein
MLTPETRERTLRIEGYVQRVDTVNRELTLHADGATVVIDVPSDCPILLRGERVKFRMIQPRDPVRVTCADGRGVCTARAVEVQPGSPLPAAY